MEGSPVAPTPQQHTTNTHCANRVELLAALRSPHTLGTTALAPYSSYWSKKKEGNEVILLFLKLDKSTNMIKDRIGGSLSITP